MRLFQPRAGPRRPRMELPQSTNKPDQEIRGEPSVAKVANYLPPRDEVGCSPVARRVAEPPLALNLALALVLTWPRVYCRAAALACRFPCLLVALARQSRRFRPRLSRAWNGRSGAPTPDCSVRRHLGLGGLAASRRWRASRQNRRRFGAELMCPSRLPWKAPLLP